MRMANGQVKLFAWLFICFSAFMCTPAVAGIETKILGFEQTGVLPGDAQHLLNVSLHDVNPNLAVWFSIYYVGVADSESLDDNNTLMLDSDHLILETKPYPLRISAEESPHRKKFSLTEYGDVVDLVDEQLDRKVQEISLPADVPADKIRVFSRTLEFTQDINSSGTVSLDISNSAVHGLRPLAVYVVAGQGDKPEALTNLTTRSSEEMQSAVPRRRMGGEWFIAKIMIMFVVLGAFIYLRRS